MDNRPRTRQSKWPLNTCRTCGGDWFREAEYYEFRREESLGPYWPTGADLVGRISIGPKPLLICLCGSPRTPSIGGIRGGHTPNAELRNSWRTASGLSSICTALTMAIRCARRGPATGHPGGREGSGGSAPECG